MKSSHTPDGESLDLVSVWAHDLRAHLVAGIGPERAEEVAALAAGAASSLSLTSAAAAALNQGGTTMSTVIETAAASHTAMKIASGGLAAALAAGGAAAVTGHLPFGSADLDAGTHSSLNVEKPIQRDAPVDLGLQTLSLDAIGTVEVAIDGTTLEVVNVEAVAGVTASILSRSEGAAEIEFRRAGETRTLLVTAVNGEVATSLTPWVGSAASAGVSGDSDAEVATSISSEVGSDANAGVSVDSGAGIDADTDADLSIGGQIGVGIDG